MAFPLLKTVQTVIGTLAVGALITSCGAVSGEAVSAPLLDTGDYPTRPPTDIRVEQDSSLRAANEQARRLADYVIVPTQADPAVQELVVTFTLPLGASRIVETLTGLNAGVADRHGFSFGFSSARVSADQQQGLQNVVLSFPTADDASAAAQEMGAVMSATTEFSERTPIPGYPNSIGMNARDSTDVRAVTAYKNVVLYQRANNPTDLADAADLVAKTLDLQQPRIDTYQENGESPVPETDSPDELLVRTLPPALGAPNGVYPGRGGLHYLTEPVRTGEAFESGAVSRVAVQLATVYESSDPEHARIFAQQRADILASGSHVASGIDGLPWARCFDYGDSAVTGIDRYRCLAAVRTSTIETVSSELGDAQQQLAAQYLLLT